jgi:parallel beta-helix repeat protein
MLLLIGNVCFAQTIVVRANTVIDSSTTYDGVDLDFSHGNFIVRNKALLSIQNCHISGTLSPNSPVLINLEDGNLKMTGNSVSIKTVGITAHPLSQSLQYVIQVVQGTVTMTYNTFDIDTPFTAGLLITTSSMPTGNFSIKNNTFTNFHGVIYLINSNNIAISNNIFMKNSYGHIVLIGNNILVDHNKIYFSGGDHLGNAIDIIDSDTVTVSKNELYTPTCHGIYVLSSRNLTIDGNRVYGGITYAINVLTYAEALRKDEPILKSLGNYKSKIVLSENVVITNNFMSQNRYGIAASDVNNMTIKNNYFSQRFVDDASRKFWTDNNILLNNVTSLVWQQNYYKEAFSQSMNGDNNKSLRLVEFPASGGVTL